MKKIPPSPQSPPSSSPIPRRDFLRKSGAAAVAALCPFCGGAHAAPATSALIAPAARARAALLAGAATNARKFFPSSRMPEAVRARLARRLFGDLWLRDEEFEHYQETLAKRVSPKDDFLLVTVNHDSVNAFAHFGGVIGMLGGLWIFCESESEFAAILAHEMAHVKQEHFKRREEKSKQTTALLIPLILGGLLADDPEVREALTIGGLGVLGSVITGYTREMEQEADAIGVLLMREAGFNPRALASVLGRFQGGGGVSEYQSTHPAPGRRAADIRARAKPDDRDASEDPNFYFLREKLRAGFNPNTKTKRRRLAQLKAGKGDANLLRYSVLLLAGRTRDEKLGAEMAESLSLAARRSSVVCRAVAENMASRGEIDPAVELLEDWRARAPENPAVSGELMRILSRAKRNEEAMAVYRGLPEELRKRGPLIRRAAAAAGGLGDDKAANIFLTEAALREGLFEQALRQVKVAERAAGSDAQTLLKIGELRKSAEKELKTLPKDK